ncbi:MAG: helix-turn-helix domain-containing protein [Firmicutes bacterium]|nr:helix-turn-helix domain-containing protein [Bacillota bacterium]
MSFSEKIKIVRDKLFLSQEKLAHEIGVSFATISRLENNRTEPSLDTRRRFFEFCESKGISFDGEVSR